MQTGNETARFALRMPAGMHTAIKVRAQANRRSMNSEILSLIESAILAGRSLSESNPEKPENPEI